jgi:GNAT superfamily N-acetyltransferase
VVVHPRNRELPTTLEPSPITRADIDELATADLSPWFNPFLPYFVTETLRCGGGVQVVREAGSLLALSLDDPAENVASVFTLSPPLAEAFVRRRGSRGMYSHVPVDLPSVPFGVWETELPEKAPSRLFRNPIRRASDADLVGVVELMREAYGAVDERWFEGIETSSEAGFVAEVGGRLAGTAWVAVVGSVARLHSLTVRLPYRRMGLGGDLHLARTLWARQMGACRVVSEIADANVASVAVARAAGMRRIGEMYLYPPP